MNGHDFTHRMLWNAARGTAILSPRVTLRAASIVRAASVQSTEDCKISEDKE